MADPSSSDAQDAVGTPVEASVSEGLPERPDRDRLVALDVDECLVLLRRKTPKIGRLAVIENGQPIVLPVNYAYDRGTVVIRTDHGAKLTAALLSSAAAFEVDEVDEGWREGWSVLIKGRLEEVSDPDELVHMARLPLVPWASGARNRYIRVLSTSITGRRLV